MIEREAKLGADVAFVMPDLADAVPGTVVEAAARLHLDAVYYDGEALPLARRGSTVRHRTGEGPARWTVKVAGEATGAVLSRREIDVDGPPSPVPAEVAALVADALGEAVTLVPVARLVTERERLAVRDASGAPLAEIDDDLVRALDGDHEVAAFREIEVELADGAPVEVLDAIVARLRAAGAGAPDPTPKLVRALRLIGGPGSAI